MAKENVFKRLKTAFNLVTGKLPDSKITTILPAETKNGKAKPVNFSDENLQLLRFWMEDTFDTPETLKNRLDRYSSLEYAYYNSSIFSKAVNLYADETLQEDVQDDPIMVDSPNKKVISYIQEFFHNLDVDNNTLKDTAFSLALYGDKFWITPTDGEKGYTEAVDTNVYAIQQRLEFNASEEIRKAATSKSYGDYIQNDSRLQMLNDLLSKSDDDMSKYFKTYLFGYQLSKTKFLPPWNVVHFRMFTSQSEFLPFGRPLMINALAPFRQLQSSKNLMALARATGFPLKVFEVLTDESMDPASKWEVVNQAREQYSNLGVQSTGKDQFTMDSELWVPQGLINFSSEETRVNLDQVADVEMLRDDLIMATDIPKGYLIVDRGAFGTSSQALLAQHKPFARKVFHIQSTILKELTQMVRLQFLMTGEFDYETPFTLSMAFPSVEESSDRLRIKSDTLRLANDIISNLGQAVGLDRDEALPMDVVQDIFSQFSFLDGDDVQAWMDAITQSRDSDAMELSEGKRNKIRERLGNNGHKRQLFKEVFFKSLRDGGFKEGVLGQKHVYFSTNNTTSDQRVILDIFNADNNKKLKG